MPENSRSERLDDAERTCPTCGGGFRPKRSDARFCSTTCRRADFEEKAHTGIVASVRELRNGKISYVIHLDRPVGLLPGQQATLK